jgi:hypothetical protein
VKVDEEFLSRQLSEEAEVGFLGQEMSEQRTEVDLNSFRSGSKSERQQVSLLTLD